MIRKNEVSKVSSVFYLVPVSAAVSGYFIFNEKFDLITILGVIIVAIGVYLTNKT
jgi:drug/metabolite transporter (DMT)-like permease